jgi:CRP/FNR family cyclic AMP-dependent transcriptional regulator
MSEKIWFLKQCPLFELLTAAEKQRLEQRAVLRVFARRQIIYFPSEPGQSVLLLARGRVKIKVLAADGRETILAFIDEGELFGELALLDPSPRNEYAEAVDDAKVIAMAREELLWLMSQHPELSLQITKLVGLRRRRIENRLRNILFRSTRERIAALLLELQDSHGEKLRQGWMIRLPLTHQELANLIGATRESVTLTLGRLQAEGLIQVRRCRLVVLDRRRLAEEAGEVCSPAINRGDRHREGETGRIVG